MQERDGPALSPLDQDRFEDLFRGWLAENQDRLEAGSSGDLEALARLCLSWAETVR